MGAKSSMGSGHNYTIAQLFLCVLDKLLPVTKLVKTESLTELWRDITYEASNNSKKRS